MGNAREPKRITVLYPLPSTKSEKKLRVAAYCRVSSNSGEQLASYRAQIQHYESYIKANPDFIFSGMYADQGISGTGLHKREAFKQMLSDAREGKIDRIMVKSLSRFGRNTLDSLHTIRELTELGVDVFFEKENIHTLESEGELFLTLVSALAENESYALSENVKWGIHRKYERGNIKSIPSGKFLGYDKDEEGHLIINEKQAEVVRRIYQEFLDGFGTHMIAKRFTEEKIPMAYGGKEWCNGHLKMVLTNEKFKGDTLFSKTFNADPLTKRRVKNRGHLPQYYYEDTHPAIIDKLTWELVQLEFIRREQFVKEHGMYMYHHHSEGNPLTGKIVCSVCGRLFCLKQAFDGGFWRCRMYTSVKEPFLCSNGNDIDAEKIKFAFVEAWNRAIQWKQQDDSDDLLVCYRIQELKRLQEEIGTIDTMPYELMLKTMSHIEVNQEGKVAVFFLAGFEVDVGEQDFIFERRRGRGQK